MGSSVTTLSGVVANPPEAVTDNATARDFFCKRSKHWWENLLDFLPSDSNSFLLVYSAVIFQGVQQMWKLEG